MVESLIGGVKISGASNEWGTAFGVLDGPSGKYICCSSHVIGGKNAGQCKVNGRVIGQTKIDARHCNGKSYLDLAAALLNQNVQSSPAIISVGRKQVTPKAFKKASVGIEIFTYGLNTKGSTQKITTINYTSHDDTGNNCPSAYSDLWLGSVRSKPGDSGSSMLDADGNIVGILTNNIGNHSWNCSAIHIPSEMGLNIPGITSVETPSLAQQKRTRRNFFDKLAVPVTVV